MPATQIHEMGLLDGTSVKFRHERALSETSARFTVWVDDGTDDREWRVDIHADGDVQVVATYRGSELANVERPSWLQEWAGNVRYSA